MRGLGKRRSQRTGWVALGVVGAFAAALLLLVALANGATDSQGGGPGAAVLAFGLPAVFTAAAVGIGWVLWRLLRKTNDDQAAYSRFFAQQTPELQQWGTSVAAKRQHTENVRDIRNPGQHSNMFVPEVTAQIAQALGVELPAGPPVVSPWAQATWRRFPRTLLGRELAMRAVAADLGAPFAPYVEPSPAGTPLPAPTVLIDGNGNAAFFQQRNEIVIDDPELIVRVVDLVMLSNMQRQERGKQAEPIPTLQTFTYVETWFPADHWLHAYPATRTRVNRWGAMGHKIDASARQFNRRFDVQTDSEEFARLVLNPAVMKALVDVYPVRFTVDAGRLVVHTHNGWLPPDDVTKVVAIVRKLARSARAAERD